MSATRSAQIIEQLFPTETRSPLRAFAILDGARDGRLHKLAATAVEHACLYAGKLPRELVEVAPYLVKLGPEEPLLRTLADEGWGHSWGVYLLTTAPLEELRRHFRRFLKVHDSKGQALLFRYYDPRVLRVYLPTCTGPELRAFFGPVSVIVLEGEAPATLMRFHRDGDTLGVQEVALGAKAKTRDPEAG